MSAKDTFRCIRRDYRIARKLNPLLDDLAIVARVAATNTMRTFTGKWDTCEPISRLWEMSLPRVRPSGRNDAWIYRLQVNLACTQFLKRHPLQGISSPMEQS